MADSSAHLSPPASGLFDTKNYRSNRIFLGIFVLVHIALLGLSVQMAPEGWSLFPWLTPHDSVLVDAGGLHLQSLFEGHELWRLLSCAFIHGPLLHLLFNGMAMLSIGRMGERLWGSKAHIILFLGSSLGSSLLAMAVVEGSLIIGASGGVFGLAVALILELRSRLRVQPELRGMSSSLSKQIGGWLLLGLGASLWTDLPISAYGHLGGAITGGILWWILRQSRMRGLGLGLLVLWFALLATGWNARWRPWKYQVAMGYEAARQEKCERAASLLEPWLDRYSQDAGILNTWAYCETESSGDLNKALDVARKALALDPEDVNIMDTVGWTLCRLGQVAEGQMLMDKAVVVSGQDPVLVDHAQRCVTVAQEARPSP